MLGQGGQQQRRGQADFDQARAAGVKLIPRFAYTITAHQGACPESGDCPPYGDAPKAIVLQHIAQLAPLLQKNADVIACVQLGFIGTWGENYYTDYFGDASSNGAGQLLDSNWRDRIDVLKAMLNALPADRMVQVRYPQFKQKYVYGIAYELGVSEATGSAKSMAIRNLLKIHRLDPEWTLPSQMDRNPMAWLIELEGLIADARRLPKPIQEELFRAGLIPYIPDDKAGDPDEE